MLVRQEEEKKQEKDVFNGKIYVVNMNRKA